MSGSDGDRGGVGGRSGTDQTDCASLRFRTTLASPDPEVIAELEVGEVLAVGLETEGDVSIIAVRNAGASLVGTIVSDRARRLRECLQRGQTYRAVVGEIEGAAVQVEVSAIA